MRSLLAIVLLFSFGCAEPETPRVCPPGELVARDPLSLEAARETHRWAALRERLRFEEARAPGHVVRLTRERTRDEPCLADLYVAGRLLFEHDFGREDGLGNELSDTRLRSPFRRVHEARFGGPETTSCRSCHWRGGVAGAGAMIDDALIYGDGDRPGSADARNPPALSGSGLVERLGAEMTLVLQRHRDEAIAEARERGAEVERALTARDVEFGVLRARPDGSVDASAVEGVDEDLVVRPFGWKGNFATIREIAENALQVHMGIQSEGFVREHAGDTELLGDGPADDPDRDGHTAELSDAQVDAVVAFIATQAAPILRPHEQVEPLEPAAGGVFAPLVPVYVDEWIEGRAIFERVGCADCHRPRLVLRDPVFRSGVVELDLATEAESPRARYDEGLGGYPVFLFSDLRRHDMGEENASTHVDRGVATRDWLTRPLWGLADSAPWSHDGAASSLDLAIARHGGEGEASRAAFEALTYEDKGALRLFLMSLRRQWRPGVPP